MQITDTDIRIAAIVGQLDELQTLVLHGDRPTTERLRMTAQMNRLYKEAERLDATKQGGQSCL